MDICGSIVWFQFNTLVVHLICFSKLLLISQSLETNSCMCYCTFSIYLTCFSYITQTVKQRRWKCLNVYLSIKSITLSTLGEPSDDVLKAVDGDLDL